jgi:atypical dual specificity phosphatase/dual specificity phosphatase 12
MLDPNELSKWNCIIEPKVRGNKSYSGLYIGDIDCAKDQYLLQKLQIGAILSVIDYPEVTLPDIYAHSKICISDSEAESLSDHFPSCFDFIENNR